jgi:hypothetical protein
VDELINNKIIRCLILKEVKKGNIHAGRGSGGDVIDGIRIQSLIKLRNGRTLPSYTDDYIIHSDYY